MGKNENKYLKLFLSTFKLSACTFGGGYVIVPLMKKKFVDELHWIDESEMIDLIAIAQSSPGAIAVNASIIIGYQVAGVCGALITVLGTVLPPLIIISTVSLFYQAFRDNIFVNMAMTGMMAGVAAVICDVVINMAKNIIKKKHKLSIFTLIGAFIAAYFLHVNVIIIILVCGVIGAVNTYFTEKARREREI